MTVREIGRCVLLIVIAGGGARPTAAQTRTGSAREQQAIAGPQVPQQPYHRYTTLDVLGRTISFYLSEEAPGGSLPLIVYIQGSGARSHFVRDGTGRVRGATGHNAIADVVRGRARLLLVEKPGVTYLDDPRDAGGATDASATFRTEHTLDRWMEAVHAAITATRALPGIRTDRMLVVGHSEGGIVAASLAALDTTITHVAVLAGGGPTQLFDLLALAREGDFFGRISDDPDARVDYVLAEWDRIRRDPDNADALFFGHPHRRWSSFLSTSTLDQLLRTRARIYVAQGSADRAVASASFETLRAELLVRGRDANFDMVEGADHSFVSRATGEDHWMPLFERILAWFLPL